MATYLTESDFITIDLGAITGKKPEEETPSNKPKNDGNPKKDKPAEAGGKTAKAPSAKIDWSKELQRRLDTNKQLSTESQETEYDIRQKFWLEFYTAAFGAEVAKDLLPIEQLQKDIEILGFKKQTNPILAFLKIKYVQTELILTQLINSNTYKAIHNALAKRYIADSEFLKSNDYNILYCRDLYLKQIADIEKYLLAQKKILPTNVTAYDPDRLDRNKRVFLQVGQKNVKSKAAKLNSLKEVNKLLGSMEISSASDSSVNTKGSSDNEDTTSTEEEKPVLSPDSGLAAFITNEACAFATLQYLSMALGSGEASEALSNTSFKKLSGEELMSASRKVASELRKVKISKEYIPEIVEAIISNVQVM